MQSNKYCKKFEAKPWKKYIEIDEITWEAEEVIIRKIYNKRIITHKTKFMMIFTEGIQTAIYKEIWEYYKYIWVLSDCTWYDNTINLTRFRKVIDISDPAYSRLKKKLIDFWMIAEKEKEYYLNPIIWVRKQEIDLDIWDLFKTKNKELYNITEL